MKAWPVDNRFGKRQSMRWTLVALTCCSKPNMVPQRRHRSTHPSRLPDVRKTGRQRRRPRFVTVFVLHAGPTWSRRENSPRILPAQAWMPPGEHVLDRRFGCGMPMPAEHDKLELSIAQAGDTHVLSCSAACV